MLGWLDVVFVVFVDLQTSLLVGEIRKHLALQLDDLQANRWIISLVLAEGVDHVELAVRRYARFHSRPQCPLDVATSSGMMMPASTCSRPGSAP